MSHDIDLKLSDLDSRLFYHGVITGNSAKPIAEPAELTISKALVLGRYSSRIFVAIRNYLNVVKDEVSWEEVLSTFDLIECSPEDRLAASLCLSGLSIKLRGVDLLLRTEKSVSYSILPEIFTNVVYDEDMRNIGLLIRSFNSEGFERYLGPNLIRKLRSQVRKI